MVSQLTEGFKNDLEVKWHNAGINDKLKPDYLRKGVELLTYVYDKGVLKLNAKYQVKSPNYPITILDHNVAVERNTSDLFTRERAIAYCDYIISKTPGLDKAFLLNLVQDQGANQSYVRF